MAEFNENPFAKNTPVTPFSNSCEFECWKDLNCDLCVNYENESKSEEAAKCKLAFHLDFGTISGSIPLWVAKEIGCNYDPLYQTCSLQPICRKRRKGDNPF